MLPKDSRGLAATLVINLYDSRCINCHKEIMPNTKTCDKCNIEWKYVTTAYAGPLTEFTTKAMRSDLEWIDYNKVLIMDLGFNVQS